MARTVRAVDATLAVRVPLNATGSLADGAVGIVERLSSVERVADHEVRGIQPGMNETVVAVRVRIELVGDRGEDVPVTRRLEEGVGIERVEAVDPAAPPDRAAATIE